MSSFMVPPLAKAGAVVAVIGYDLAPKGMLTLFVDIMCSSETSNFIIPTMTIAGAVSAVMILLQKIIQKNGSAVAQDRGAAGSSLVGVTVLCPWARTLILA